MNLYKDTMPYFDKYKQVYGWNQYIQVYCGPPIKFGHPKILQWSILGTQLPLPG